MGFINIEEDDQFNPIYYVDSEEVKLEVKRASMEVGKESGKPYALFFMSPNDGEHDDIRHMLSIPTPELKEEDITKWKKANTRVVEFFASLGLNPNDADLQDTVGESGWYIVGYKEDDYGIANTIKRPVLKKKK